MIIVTFSVIILSMQVNNDDLSELLQNIGDDMWALSDDTIQSLGKYHTPCYPIYY